MKSKTVCIEKPFKIIHENLYFYHQKLKEAQNLTYDKMKMILQNAQPAENAIDQFKSNCCIICQNLAHDHVICSGCDNTIMCRSCKDNWQKQKAGQFQCPSCKSTQLPRNPTRIEQSYMDNILVMCQISQCKRKDQPMSLTEYKQHQCIDYQSLIECPQKCGQIINYLENDQPHYQECKNSVVCCLICSSQIKISQVDSDNYQLLIRKYLINQQKVLRDENDGKKNQNIIETCQVLENEQNVIEQINQKQDQTKIAFQAQKIEKLESLLSQEKLVYQRNLQLEREKYLQVLNEKQQLQNELSQLHIQNQNENEQSQDEIKMLEYLNQQLNKEIEKLQKQKEEAINKNNQTINEHKNFQRNLIRERDSAIQKLRCYELNNFQNNMYNSIVYEDKSDQIQSPQEASFKISIKPILPWYREEVSTQKKNEMQLILNKDPQISQKATQKFIQEGALNIDVVDGQFYKVWFHQDFLIIKQLKNIEIQGIKGKFNYNGMVHKKKDVPHGYGRAIRIDKLGFIDGQFKNGKRHGLTRWIGQNGEIQLQQWNNGDYINDVQKI